MPTIIEKDSPLVPLLVLAVVFLILLGGGLGLAYLGGVFTGKNEVAENDKRIVNQALVNSSPSIAPAPGAANQSARQAPPPLGHNLLIRLRDFRFDVWCFFCPTSRCPSPTISRNKISVQ